MAGKTHLIIPDSHAHPEEHNRRFTWIGKLIVDIKPDVVVNLGDLWDMPSLSGHSSKKELETKRYQADVSIGRDAMERIDESMKKAKKKRPRRVFCLGNHEDRIAREVRSSPLFEGKIGLSDLGLEDSGWEVYPFLTPAIIDGIAYVHYFTSGVMGRPIGGENVARTILNKKHMSGTQGHDHRLDYAISTRADGRRIQGLGAGVFQDYITKWNNTQSEELWWSGLTIKRQVEDGVYDPEFISIKRLRREYG